MSDQGFSAKKDVILTTLPLYPILKAAIAHF